MQGDSTYTAVVDNLNDGSELASEGATADQHDAANLDQLPGSNFDIDIGHGEILDGEQFSALDPVCMGEYTHGRPGVGGYVGRVVVERSRIVQVGFAKFGCAHTLLA